MYSKVRRISGGVGQDHNFDPAVLGLAFWCQICCDGLIFAAPKRLNAGLRHAVGNQNIRNRAGPSFGQLLVVGRIAIPIGMPDDLKRGVRIFLNVLR